MTLGRIKTVNGHFVPEAASALQKCLRRGLLDDAIYWAVDLHLSGFGEYVWKRLRIVSSEDVGPADRYLPATIEALYVRFQDQVKAKKKSGAPAGDRLTLVHAVYLLATAPKSRVIDHATLHHFRNHAELRRDVPDFALDQHTNRGRAMGRGADHFFTEGTQLANESEEIKDPYRKLARAAMNKPAPADAVPEIDAKEQKLFD